MQAVVEEHPWGPNSVTDSNPGRQMHARAIDLKDVRAAVRRDAVRRRAVLAVPGCHAC